MIESNDLRAVRKQTVLSSHVVIIFKIPGRHVLISLLRAVGQLEAALLGCTSSRSAAERHPLGRLPGGNAGEV